MPLSRHPWLFNSWQVRAKFLRGFFRDCSTASQFCMLLSRHPWLFNSWQVRVKSLHEFFWDCRIDSLFYMLLSRLPCPPSVDFFRDCSTTSQFCRLLSRHPWLYISWQAREKIFAFVSDSEFLLHIYSIEEMYYAKYFKKIFSHLKPPP